MSGMSEAMVIGGIVVAIASVALLAWLRARAAEPVPQPLPSRPGEPRCEADQQVCGATIWA